jgi:hypothetical protein
MSLSATLICEGSLTKIQIRSPSPRGTGRVVDGRALPHNRIKELKCWALLPCPFLRRDYNDTSMMPDCSQCLFDVP